MLIICDSEGGKGGGGEGRCNFIIHVCDRKEGSRYNMTIILVLFEVYLNKQRLFYQYPLPTLSVVALSANFRVTLPGPIVLHYQAILLNYQLVVTLSLIWNYIIGWCYIIGRCFIMGRNTPWFFQLLLHLP